MYEKNPLSPHLEIYRWQISSLLSITHRVVGVVNSIAITLICLWSICLLFGEDNYQIMMRSQTHKLVYYIGQEEGELYDLKTDAGELWNLWDKPEASKVKSGMLMKLLNWMATSNYYNAGYKRQRSRHYGMRWPTQGDAYLHGGKGKPQPRLVDL